MPSLLFRRAARGDGALAIVNRDGTVPLIQQAVGALSLTHKVVPP